MTETSVMPAQSTIDRIPLPDASVDCVISNCVLNLAPSKAAVFLEIARVLKPGGRAVVSAMHPAMFLRGSQARFTDPVSGELVQPGSIAHTLGAFVMAAVKAGLHLASVEELAPDSDFAARYPRAGKYIGWPMLVVFTMMRRGSKRGRLIRPGNSHGERSVPPK